MSDPRNPRSRRHRPLVPLLSVALAAGAALPASAQAASVPSAALAGSSPAVVTPMPSAMAARVGSRVALPDLAPATATLPAAAPAALPGAKKPRPKAAPYCPVVYSKRYGKKRLVTAAFCGRRMSDVEMVAVLRRAGWSWSGMPVTLATFMAESNGYIDAVHLNRARDGRITSIDRSWVQINDRYHPWIKRIDYRNPVVAARHARALAIRDGLDIWHGYGKRHRHAARAAKAIRMAKARGVR